MRRFRTRRKSQLKIIYERNVSQRESQTLWIREVIGRARVRSNIFLGMQISANSNQHQQRWNEKKNEKTGMRNIRPANRRNYVKITVLYIMRSWLFCHESHDWCISSTLLNKKFKINVETIESHGNRSPLWTDCGTLAHNINVIFAWNHSIPNATASCRLLSQTIHLLHLLPKLFSLWMEFVWFEAKINGLFNGTPNNGRILIKNQCL